MGWTVPPQQDKAVRQDGRPASMDFPHLQNRFLLLCGDSNSDATHHTTKGRGRPRQRVN